MPNPIYHTPDLTPNQQVLMFQYKNICEGARGREKGANTENHHINPTCLKGLDVKENRVNLTGIEHFNAHHILAKIYHDHCGLTLAAFMMSHKDGIEITAEEYAVLRENHSENMRTMALARPKGQNKYNNPGIAAQAEKMTGRTKYTHQYLMDSSIRQTGQTKETHECRMLISTVLTDRTKHTHQYIADRSEKVTGRTKETHAGHASCSLILSSRNKYNCDYLKEKSEKMTGQTKETSDAVLRMSITKSGQNASNTPGIARMAEEQRKIPTDQYPKLIDLKNSGYTAVEIQEHFHDLNIDISISHISTIYNREIKKIIELPIRKKNQISEDLKLEIFNMRENKISLKLVQKYLESLEITASISFISAIHIRIKKDIDK